MKLLKLLVIFLLIIPFTYAQDDFGTDFDDAIDTTPISVVDIDKSVNWLMQQPQIIAFETSLTVLAATKSDVVSNQDAVNKLLTLKNKQTQCWPATNCNVKDTAMALFALSRTGSAISLSFLTSQEQPNTQGEWLLQIETQATGTCNIKYGGTTKTIQIEQGRIKSNLCTSYTTQFSLNDCLETNLLKDKTTLAITVQCGPLGSGRISLVYKVEDKYFLIDDVSNILTTTLRIKNSNFGDYDSTLHASWALKSMDKDVNSIIWLKRFYTPNVISSALMYLITGEEAYVNDLLTLQDQTIGNFGSVYETALATLALRKQGIFTTEAEFAKSWLESQMLPDGSWNNDIKDTAMAIYGVFAPLDITLPVIPSPTTVMHTLGCNNNGICEIMFEESSLNCPDDCYCGDEVCDSLEDEIFCPDDCETIITNGFEPECYDDTDCDPGYTCEYDECIEEERHGFFFWFFIILLILGIPGGLAYFYYKKYYLTGKQLFKFKKPGYKPPLLRRPSERPAPAAYPRPAYKPVYKPKPRKTLIEKQLEESLKEAKKLLGKK